MTNKAYKESKTPLQTVTVELTKEQIEYMEYDYFDHALSECTVMTDIKGKNLLLCVTHPDHDVMDDSRPKLKINLDKELRHLASGDWMASDYDELTAMVKSFGRTYDFLKRYLKTWETDEEKVPNQPPRNASIT